MDWLELIEEDEIQENEDAKKREEEAGRGSGSGSEVRGSASQPYVIGHLRRGHSPAGLVSIVMLILHFYVHQLVRLLWCCYH